VLSSRSLDEEYMEDTRNTKHTMHTHGHTQLTTVLSAFRAVNALPVETMCTTVVRPAGGWKARYRGFWPELV